MENHISKAKPMNDVAFKKLMGNSEIARSFIEDILEIKVETAELLETHNYHLPTEFNGSKAYYTAVDVKVNLENGVTVIVEAQVSYHDGFTNRLMVYLSEDIQRKLDEVKKQGIPTHNAYPEIRPSYVIAILADKKFRKVFNKPFERLRLKNDDNEVFKMPIDEERKQEPFLFAFLDVTRYNECSDMDSKTLEWLEFFGNKANATFENPAIQMADKLLEQTSFSKEEWEKMIKADLDLMTYYAVIDTERKDSIEKGVTVIVEAYEDNAISKENAIYMLIKLGLSEQEAEARLT